MHTHIQSYLDMDEYFGEMECRCRSDTIMMSLLRSAMDNAHERVQSKDGPIECLHERSKFYELAIIQIEGSLKLIQEEAADNRVLESSREKMLSDLVDLKHLLHGRLKDMKTCIVEKDKELLERLENEFKLRQALESKERELHSLRSKLELERTKSESIQEFLSSEEGNTDEGKEGDFCELKNSVDQQVLNIKQRLESKENELLYSKIKSMDDWLREQQDAGIEEKSSDIDILKGTLELAFGRMQNAEVRPLEKKWRWSIEEEIVSILIKGFINDLEQNFEMVLGERDYNISSIILTKEDCMEMIDEMIQLRGELEAIWCRNETEEKRVKDNTENEEKCSEGNLQQMRRTTSEPMPLMDYTVVEEDKEDSSEGNYVAKMIKNHESIISKQREEINWLKLKEALRKKDGGLSAKREKELDGLERRAREVIARLENVIKWKDRLCTKTSVHNKHTYQEQGATECSMNGPYDAILKAEIETVKQQRDDSNLMKFALEEHYIVLLKGLFNDFYLDAYINDTERSIWEDLLTHYLMEMVNECKHRFASGFVEMQIREEIYCTVFKEMEKDFISKHYVPLLKNQNGTKEGGTEECCLEHALREDLYAVFFHEMVEDLKERIQFNSREADITGFDELANVNKSTASFAVAQHQEVRVPILFQKKIALNSKIPESTIESLLKEDVYMVFLGETNKAWKMEKFAIELEAIYREEIYQFVVLQAVKDAVQDQNHLADDSYYPNELDEIADIEEEENLIQELDNLLEYFEVEEELAVKEKLEMKEHKLHNVRTLNWLLNEDENCFSPVSDKLEKALEQLGATKELLRELENQINPNTGFLQGQPEMDDFLSFDNALAPLIELQQVLTNFESTVDDLLQMQSSRLGQFKHQIDALVQLVGALRKRESLYKKAFLRRCQNLRLAEIEVDLLGDQVDGLVGLLGKIYLTLDQYSPQCSRYFDVSDMLKQIKQDLTCVATHT